MFGVSLIIQGSLGPFTCKMQTTISNILKIINNKYYYYYHYHYCYRYHYHYYYYYYY